ncbi:MAG TPA: GNAT family N-acetyltransferase [Xanthobacteraceae bacterium]|nr:GNAT family N-acetyltransferase [Xanthobacteraceae bacterium]
MIGRILQFFRRPEAAILDARPSDAAALAALHRVSFRHGWSESEFERLLSDRAAVAHVARTNGGRGPVVGFVLSHRVDQEAEILLVALAPGERGKGTATRVLAKHLSRLAAFGVARVFLEVDEGNAAARKLYTRAGFSEVGRRKGYYRKPEGNAAALILARNLNG